MTEWQNTEWQKELKNKPYKYWIRDEIEEIIKEENKYSDYEIASFLEMKKFEEKYL